MFEFLLVEIGRPWMVVFILLDCMMMIRLGIHAQGIVVFRLPLLILGNNANQLFPWTVEVVKTDFSLTIIAVYLLVFFDIFAV